MNIKVNAHPGSKEERIEKNSNGEYDIWIKERAEDGKANIRIINLLSKELNINYKKIVIKNPTSRKKNIEIKN
jgi:uncharacterized protein YggU (UPF0235/DUF167 family)